MKPWTTTVALGVLMLVLVIGAGGWTIYQNQQSEQQQNCLTDFANELTTALDARTEASADTAQAQDKLWRSILAVLTAIDEPNTVEQLTERIDRYLQLRERAERARAANPYPDPPQLSC